MDKQYFERVYDKTYRSLLKYAIVHLSDPTDKGYMIVGCAIADLPETFTLTVTWHGSTVEIPLNRDDVLLVDRAENVEPYYDAVFDY